MLLQKSFKCIEVKLNHRLIRKILKVLKWYIDKYGNDDYILQSEFDIRYMYKYLKRMRRHKNYKRFTCWLHPRKYFDKEISKRKLYIYPDAIHIYNARHTEPRVELWKDFEAVNDILNWYFSKRNDCPF